MRKTVEERKKDALVLLEKINRKNSTSFTSDILPPSDISKADAVRHFKQLGMPRGDAKDLAWVFTCPRPWDDDNSKPYLSRRCWPYRMWDNFWEADNKFWSGFRFPC
jgi:hypothetical protein